jgi:hypothetical protein
MLLPIQIAVCNSRGVGALVVLVAAHWFVIALYLPPVFKKLLPPVSPPQMSISLPVQAAVCAARPVGALEVLVAAQISNAGSYRPPVLK